MKLTTLAIRVCALPLLGWAAMAAPLLFTDEALFQQAAANAGIVLKMDSFEDLPLGFNNGALDRDGYSFDSPQNRTFVGGSPLDGTDGTKNLLIGSQQQPAMFDFDSPVQAFSVDVRDALNILGGEFVISIEGGAPLTLFSGTLGSRNLQFVGVIDLDGMSRIELDSTDLVDFFSLDRAQYGAAAVPEPGTNAMLALGLLGLSALSRRRK